MELPATAHRWLLIALAAGAFSLASGQVRAQSAQSLNAQLNGLAPEVNAALASQAQAGQVIAKLDQAEALFARLAENPKNDRALLVATYSQLENMLSRMYTTYKQKKDDCISQIQNGGQCDYTEAEQLSLQALYPLSWLRFQGAALYSTQGELAKKLLNEAIDGFTESTLVIFQPELIRENLLGRAYCERELGKFDKTEYDRAIGDFKQIMADGPNTKQYTAAKQGMATTYAAMGKLDEAARLTGQLASGATGAQRQGMEMLRLTQLFKAEFATSNPAKRAEYHKEAVEFMRAKQNDKTSWAIILAAVAQNVRDPIAEFGRQADPFEQWLLANVLYSKKQHGEAAKYFLAAARSGQYPKAYKFAADIYYVQHNYGVVQSVVTEMAHRPGNPDAQWASYMRFKLPLLQYDQGGRKNQQLEKQWMAAAEDYLKVYPRGVYAYEPRFRLADREQRNGHYLAAVAMYEQVTGNAEYQFYAKYNAAESNYLALVEAAGKQKDGAKSAAPAINRAQIRKAAIDGLLATINAEPALERRLAGQRSLLRDMRGRAIYMYVSLIQREPKLDQAQIASLLDNYESLYPAMKDRFTDVAEWRMQALDHLGRYDDLERDVRGLVGRAHRDGVSNDFMKEVGLDFWRASATKKASGDKQGATADAKITTIAYEYFADQVHSGKAQAKNLTGTLSILGQAYIALGEVPKAENIFNQVVKADPGSPDANAGLARIAQAKKDYKDAVELWTRVETVAAESDDLWYEAKYNIALIYAAQGNAPGACNKLAVTRAEHPSLGTPEMKVQWDALQRRLCLGKGAQ